MAPGRRPDRDEERHRQCVAEHEEAQPPAPRVGRQRVVARFWQVTEERSEVGLVTRPVRLVDPRLEFPGIEPAGEIVPAEPLHRGLALLARYPQRRLHRRKGNPKIAAVANPQLIDVHHLGHERVVASYLLETDDGPALHDCGPASTIPGLKAGLAEHGLALQDVRHLLLSHIHLDHAGAAGPLVREHPGLQVHVSEVGAPHLVDPSRLERSARRLYGETFDSLWGELAPIPEHNVHVVGEHVLGLACFPSPGHASHHVCYLHEDGTLYAGDAAGVRIQPSRYVLPPTPPPDIDLEGWEHTFAEIERRGPARLALTHFGVADDPARHLAEVRERLARWAERVREGVTQADFVAEVEAELEGEDVELFEYAVPPDHCYLGLRRYWDKQAEAA